MQHAPETYRLMSRLSRRERVRRSIATTLPEIVTPVEASEVADWLESCDWHTCDAASDLFQARWSRTDGGILNDPGYHGFILVVFAGKERIEFIGPDGRTVKLFPNGQSFEVRPS